MSDIFNDAMPHPERTDGAFRCRLCPDTFPREDNEWCACAASIVCDDCCRAIMMGEQRMLDAISKRRGRRMPSEEVVAKCMECDRLVRLVSERAFDGDIGVRMPLH